MATFYEMKGLVFIMINLLILAILNVMWWQGAHKKNYHARIELASALSYKNILRPNVNSFHLENRVEVDLPLVLEFKLLHFIKNGKLWLFMINSEAKNVCQTSVSQSQQNMPNFNVKY